MSKKPPVHTVPHGDGWANRREGSHRISKSFDTKKDAMSAGRATAKNQKTEHFIHDQHGQIQSRNSYGNDPYPPHG